MPITMKWISELYEMENHELMNHIIELQKFIESFNGNDVIDLANQIRDLKAENKILKSKSHKHYEAMEKLIENEAKKSEKIVMKITKRDNQIKELKEENEKLKEEHKKFDEIWKTEGITEQDIIDMKRQISDQCDLIKKLKEDIKKSRSINTTNRKEKAELRKQIKELKTDNKELMSAEKQFEFHCNYYKCYYDFLTAETTMKPDKDFIRDWCLEHDLGLELRKKLNASIL